ncbi:MAG: hypothetical protein EBZ47_06310 [Chlamydiae bacterium]|nr:hypothetical protein [Chlamydiota bacterium]
MSSISNISVNTPSDSNPYDNKENVHPGVTSRVASAAKRVQWAEPLGSLRTIETRQELPGKDLWHDMESLGLEALVARNHPEEIAEYESSFAMLQDPSVDGVVCQLYHPEKYRISQYLQPLSHEKEPSLEALVVEALPHLSQPDLLALVDALQKELASRGKNPI